MNQCVCGVRKHSCTSNLKYIYILNKPNNDLNADIISIFEYLEKRCLKLYLKVLLLFFLVLFSCSVRIVLETAKIKNTCYALNHTQNI